MQNSRNLPQVNLRVSPALKEWIAKKAESNFRSMNSEIVARLEESKKREEQAHAPS